MIKHMGMAIGLFAAVCMFAGSAVAADEAPTKAPPARGPGDGGPMGELRGLKLTDEQKAQIKDIMDAAKADAEKAEGREARMKIMKDAFEKIKTDVLTDEQRKQLAELKDKIGAVRDGLAAKFKLTDDQKAKIKEIMDAAKADAKDAEGPEAKMKVMKDAFEKIQKDVLTDDQRKALEDLKTKLGVNPEEIGKQLEKVKLTDDQKAKIKEIMTQAKADAKDAEGGEAKMKIMKDAFEKIKTDVLTDDQRKAVGELKNSLDNVRERFMQMIQQEKGHGEAPKPAPKDAPKAAPKDTAKP